MCHANIRHFVHLREVLQSTLQSIEEAPSHSERQSVQFIEEKAVEIQSFLAVVTHYHQSVILCYIMAGFLNPLKADTVKIHALTLPCLPSYEDFHTNFVRHTRQALAFTAHPSQAQVCLCGVMGAPQHLQKRSHSFHCCNAPRITEYSE